MCGPAVGRHSSRRLVLCFDAMLAVLCRIRPSNASRRRQLPGVGTWLAIACVTAIGWSCATTPPAPLLAPNGDAGANNRQPGASASAANSAAIDEAGDTNRRHPLPPPPVPALWAGVVRPNPTTVNMANPGGDVEDPQASALVRLLEEPFGMLRDKDDQVHIELPDSKNWKRVRYRAFEHLVGFRYGEKYHAVTVLLANDTRAGRPAESLACIRQVETLARPRARALSVEFGRIDETEIEWRGKHVIIHSVEGAFPWGFKRVAFSAAWAAYPAYEKACLIYGIGIKHDDHPELARQLRDRWILEAVPRVDPRTVTKAERKP